MPWVSDVSSQSRIITGAFGQWSEYNSLPISLVSRTCPVIFLQLLSSVVFLVSQGILHALWGNKLYRMPTFLLISEFASGWMAQWIETYWNRFDDVSTILKLGVICFQRIVLITNWLSLHGTTSATLSNIISGFLHVSMNSSSYCALCLWRARRTARRKVVLNRQTSALQQRIGKIWLVTCATEFSTSGRASLASSLNVFGQMPGLARLALQAASCQNAPTCCEAGAGWSRFDVFPFHSDAVPWRCFGSVRACIDSNRSMVLRNRSCRSHCNGYMMLYDAIWLLTSCADTCGFATWRCSSHRNGCVIVA